MGASENSETRSRLRRMQDAGAVGMRVVQDPEKHRTTLVTFHSKDMPEWALAESHELRQLLGLSLEANEFNLVFGSVPANDHEVAMKTRSLLHILSLMAAQVEVPPEDIARGYAVPGVREADKQGGAAVNLARILSSKNKPTGAYVAVV